MAELIGYRYLASRLDRRPPLFLSPRSGHYLSRLRGRGMEFAEVRPYLPGDDVRTMDWRVTARTGQPHTKLFREEREQQVVLLVDFRQSMHFATAGVFKSVLASRLAALLAWQAQQAGDRLGGMVFSASEHLEVRPQLGRAAVLTLLYQLAHHSAWQPIDSAQWSAPLAPRSTSPTPHPFWRVLLRLRRVATPGTQVTIISDFRQMQRECEPHFRELSRHCELRFIWLYDRLEQELPPAGLYPFQAEGRTVLVNTASASLRRRYQQQFQQRSDYLHGLADRYSIALLQGDTTSDPLLLLSQKWYRRLKGYVGS